MPPHSRTKAIALRPASARKSGRETGEPISSSELKIQRDGQILQESQGREGLEGEDADDEPSLHVDDARTVEMALVLPPPAERGIRGENRIHVPREEDPPAVSARGT